MVFKKCASVQTEAAVALDSKELAVLITSIQLKSYETNQSPFYEEKC